ncbi:MAG: hypothetical protein ACHP9Z_14310 [Streptosporangiales bacterium]
MPLAQITASAATSPPARGAPAPAAGCHQVSDHADHQWRIGGCFAEDGPGTLVTDQPVQLDGAELVPRDAGTIEFTDVGGPDARVLSSEPASVDLRVNGLDVLLSHVTLDWSMSGVQIRLLVPDGTTVAGIPISGVLILTAESDGTMTGTVSASLPEILGGGTGTLSITSVYGTGVTAMSLTAAHASLAGLFTIDRAELSWSPSGWLVAGSASIPSGQGTGIGGRLDFSPDGQLRSGHLSIHGLSLAGLIDLSSFDITYHRDTGWTGSARFAHQGVGAHIALGFSPAGQLTSGTIASTGTVALFGVLEMREFRLSFDSGHGSWDLALRPTLPGGGSIEVALSASHGALGGASFALRDVSFAGLLTIRQVAFSYAASPGSETYAGAAGIVLPGPAHTTVAGALTFTNGAYTDGSLSVSNLSVPLGDSIYLQSLAARLLTAPWTISGSAGLSAGPAVHGISLVGLEGSLAYTFPTAPSPAGVYRMGGQVTVGGQPLGTGQIVVSGEPAAAFRISLGAGEGHDGLHYGSLIRLHGSVAGALSPTFFSATGEARFTVLFITVEGHVAVNTRGIAACGRRGGVSDGFTWLWGGSPQARMGDCTTTGF